MKRKLLLSEHTKEPKTFQCAHCDKSFKRRDNIYRHLKQDHPGEDVSPYRPNRPVLPPVKDVSEVTCKECNKHCGTRYGLKRHMIKHSDEKNHVCTECGKLYKGALQLKTHMKFHRGEYDYHCDQCDAKYVSSSALYNHKIQKHSGGFQLTCEHCGQTNFSLGDNKIIFTQFKWNIFFRCYSIIFKCLVGDIEFSTIIM